MRLATYTLAAGAACLSQQTAQGAVVYVDPADIIVSPGPLNLDIDANTVDDFNVDTNVLIAGPFFSSSVTAGALSSNGISAPLGVGQTVDGSLAFDPTQTIVSAYFDLKTSDPGGSRSVVLGLRFNIDSNTHYGWLRLAGRATFASQPEARVFDWAYEDTPNTALTAPAALADPYAVPEPSSIPLFALGAAGIGALKARRKSQQS